MHEFTNSPISWYIKGFMLALNLAKIRTPQEHFEQVYQPEVLGAEGDVYTIVAPVSLVFRYPQGQGQFPPRGAG